MTNTTNAAPVTAADVAAAVRASQVANGAVIDAGRNFQGICDALDPIEADALENGGFVTPDALAALNDLAAATCAAIMAGERALSLSERTPPDVFAAGMRLGFDAARGEA